MLVVKLSVVSILVATFVFWTILGVSFILDSMPMFAINWVGVLGYAWAASVISMFVTFLWGCSWASEAEKEQQEEYNRELAEYVRYNKMFIDEMEKVSADE